MLRTPSRAISWGLLALLVGGCCYPVRERADLLVCDLAARPADVAPASTDESLPAPRRQTGSAEPGFSQAGEANAPGDRRRPITLSERLRIPPELPGANAPPIRVPPQTVPGEQR